MPRAGAGVVWMLGSIVALAACGGAKATAPAAKPDDEPRKRGHLKLVE